MSEFVPIEKGKFLEIVFCLNEIVVSLDRIGSSCTGEGLAKCLEQFIVDHDVMRKLAKSRGYMHDALDAAQLSDAEEIEKMFAKLPYWDYKSANPSQ